VVGLICIQIFGYSHPRAKEYAIDLGLAMQLTNILRDIKEDLKRDRIYLPLDDLRDFGYSVDELKTEEFNRNFRELMEFEAQRARQYFGSGFKLLPFLSPRSRACPAVIGQIYSHILDRIEAQDFNVFDGRVSLSKREKYMVTAQTWVRSLLPTFSTPT
jgi:phytoene synthase